MIEVNGQPGVWFISLDAERWLAVKAARRFFHLPYFHAAMKLSARGERIEHQSERHARQNRVAFHGAYWPTGAPYLAQPGTLEHFLTERYCLYTQTPKGVLLRADVHHAPWPLQPAAAEIAENTIATAQGIAASGPPVLLHFARRIDVIVWSPTPVNPFPAKGISPVEARQ